MTILTILLNNGSGISALSPKSVYSVCLCHLAAFDVSLGKIGPFFNNDQSELLTCC